MASKFVFNTTRSILCEVGGARSRIGEVFHNLGCKSQQTILLVTDPGITDLKLHERAEEGLEKQGFKVRVFNEVMADPNEEVIRDAVEMAKAHDVAGIVGFGGGSSMDVAKLVAFLSHDGCTQKIYDIYGVDACQGSRLPLVQIPTTAGTGSEVTPISIVTTGESEKKGIVSQQLLPDCAILDGSLTLGLPAHITAATGIDAMVHAIEAYTSRKKKNLLSDMFAKEAMRLLGENIRHVCTEDGSRDANARGDMLLGSLLAGMAFANAPVAAVHALAYPIGAHFKVSHGLSNSLMLPHVLRFNALDLKCAQHYTDLSWIAFKDTKSPSASPFESAALFANEFEELAAELKLPQYLKDVGITENDLEKLTEDAMKQTRLLPNNPREVTAADALRIYEAAL